MGISPPKQFQSIPGPLCPDRRYAWRRSKHNNTLFNQPSNTATQSYFGFHLTFQRHLSGVCVASLGLGPLIKNWGDEQYERFYMERCAYTSCTPTPLFADVSSQEYGTTIFSRLFGLIGILSRLRGSKRIPGQHEAES